MSKPYAVLGNFLNDIGLIIPKMIHLLQTISFTQRALFARHRICSCSVDLCKTHLAIQMSASVAAPAIEQSICLYSLFPEISKCLSVYETLMQ